jgi:hypothetical protein
MMATEVILKALENFNHLTWPEKILLVLIVTHKRSMNDGLAVNVQS